MYMYLADLDHLFMLRLISCIYALICSTSLLNRVWQMTDSNKTDISYTVIHLKCTKAAFPCPSTLYHGNCKLSFRLLVMYVDKKSAKIKNDDGGDHRRTIWVKTPTVVS